MALELHVEPCAGCTSQDVSHWCEPCRRNARTLAEARQHIERLSAALDAWKSVAQNLWALARMAIDE